MTDTASSRTYFDTSIFVDAYEGAGAHTDKLRHVFNGFTKKPKLAVTSEFTLAELFGKESARGWVWQNRFYLNLLVFNEAFELLPVTRDILIETGAFRRVARVEDRVVKLGDAIHAVTAVKAECRYLFTCDKRLLVPHPLSRLAPDEHGFAALDRILNA